MTQIKKPEELAFAATQLISDTVLKIRKDRVVMLLSAGAIGVGMTFASGSVLALVTFAGAYSLWDMNRLRKATLELRDAFNQVAEGLGEHDSVYQLEPLKRAFGKVNGFNKNDLNIAAHYRANKFNTLLMGGLALASPLLLPLAINGLITCADSEKLKVVRNSIPEAQENLRKKYPLSFG